MKRGFHKKIFVKATPLSVISMFVVLGSISGILFLWFHYDDHGGLGSGLLSLWLLAAVSVFRLDRFLIKQFLWRTVVILESIFLLVFALDYFRNL